MQTWSTGWCRGECWPWHGCDLNLMRFPNEKYPMQKPFCQPFEPNNGQFIFYTMVPQSFSLFQSDAHEQHCRGRCYQRRPHWYRNRVHDQWLLPSIVPIEPIEPSAEQTMWLSNGWGKKKNKVGCTWCILILFFFLLQDAVLNKNVRWSGIKRGNK